MAKFKIGDRVEIRDKEVPAEVPRGVYGTVREILKNGIDLAIEFDVFFPRGHACSGACRPGFGYWLYESQIQLVEEKKEEEIPKNRRIKMRKEHGKEKEGIKGAYTT
jgi:hypothetical protein